MPNEKYFRFVKVENARCSGCGGIKKCLFIGSDLEGHEEDKLTIYHQCKQWLLGKLRGNVR